MGTTGLNSWPEIEMKRHIINGIAFNVLVVGPTGIGKTTLIDSLFGSESHDGRHEQDTYGDGGVKLKVKELLVPNGNVKMSLKVIETHGFDHQPGESYKPILEYILGRLEDYRTSELKEVDQITDNRVHCCIYMLSPIANRLRPVDLLTMKQLGSRVCVIPVIAQSDILTKQQRAEYKSRVVEQLLANKIQVYTSTPLAVAASNDIEENHRRVRIRSYPWGKLVIEDNTEFLELRQLVLQNMSLLLDETHNIIYRRYLTEAKKFKAMSDQVIEQHFSSEKMELQHEIDLMQRRIAKTCNKT